MLFRLGGQTRSRPAAPRVGRLVGGAAHGALEGLVEHLTQRRVRVDGHGELAEVDAMLDRVRTLLNEIGGVEADNVHANDLGRVLAKHHLGDPVALALGSLFWATQNFQKFTKNQKIIMKINQNR